MLFVVNESVWENKKLKKKKKTEKLDSPQWKMTRTHVCILHTPLLRHIESIKICGDCSTISNGRAVKVSQMFCCFFLSFDFRFLHTNLFIRLPNPHLWDATCRNTRFTVYHFFSSLLFHLLLPSLFYLSSPAYLHKNG